MTTTTDPTDRFNAAWIVGGVFFAVGLTGAIGWAGFPIAIGITVLASTAASIALHNGKQIADKLERLSPSVGQFSGWRSRYTTTAVEPGQGQGGVCGGAAGADSEAAQKPPAARTGGLFVVPADE